MTIYMAFPVGLFYYFNQPAMFEKWVVETKRKLYPPENKDHHDELQRAIKEVRIQKEEDILRQWESNK